MRWQFLIGCCVLTCVAIGVGSPTRAWAQAQPAAHAPKASEENESEEEQAARGVFAAGTLAFKEGRYEDALANFREAYRLSNHAELLFNIGLMCERLFRFSESIEAYEAYLSALPNPANRAAVEERIRLMRTKIAPPPTAEPIADSSAPPVEPAQEAQQQQQPADDKGAHVLSPWYVWSGLALTVGTGAVTVWSALDTRSAHDDFQKHPTQSASDHGEAAQLRTQVLLGATATFAVATTVVAVFFTDWHGGEQTERKGVALAPWVSRNMAGLSLSRGF